MAGFQVGKHERQEFLQFGLEINTPELMADWPYSSQYHIISDINMHLYVCMKCTNMYIQQQYYVDGTQHSTAGMYNVQRYLLH